MEHMKTFGMSDATGVAHAKGLHMLHACVQASAVDAKRFTCVIRRCAWIGPAGDADDNGK
jgi:hypothetical protein